MYWRITMARRTKYVQGGPEAVQQAIWELGRELWGDKAEVMTFAPSVARVESVDLGRLWKD